VVSRRWFLLVICISAGLWPIVFCSYRTHHHLTHSTYPTRFVFLVAGEYTPYTS
jgi:hypothetical protein